MVKTYGFWFEEIERLAALMSEAGGSEETTTKMKSWFALTLQVKYNNLIIFANSASLDNLILKSVKFYCILSMNEHNKFILYSVRV